MKTFKLICGVGSSFLILATLTNSAFGQAQIINLDENGVGYITPSQLFPYTVAPEPVSGLTTLVYTLPFAGVAGDVLVDESSGNQLSDVLRFDGLGHVYVFSDNSDGVDSLADTSGLPPVILPNPAGPLVESGVEGGYQDVDYIPTPTEPGYKAAGPVVYHFISDVPEPGSLALILLGGGSFLAFRKRA